MPYAHNKGADQPAHPRSLISAFVVRCLDSIMHILPIDDISRLYLACVSEQTGLSLTWSKTPKTGFLVTRFTLFPSQLFVFLFHLVSSVECRNRLYRFMIIALSFIKYVVPCHEIMVFFVLRKHILQTRMCSHLVGLDV